MDSDTKEMWSKIVVGLVFYIIILTIASFLLLPNFWSHILVFNLNFWHYFSDQVANGKCCVHMPKM